MLISDSTFGIPKKNHEKMILFDSYLKSPFYLVNLYEYFEKKNTRLGLPLDIRSWKIVCIVIASFQQELGFLIQT